MYIKLVCPPLGVRTLAYRERGHFQISHSEANLICQGNQLTVTVLASISVNMNSPPSKSPFRYNSALKIKETYRSAHSALNGGIGIGY